MTGPRTIDAQLRRDGTEWTASIDGRQLRVDDPRDLLQHVPGGALDAVVTVSGTDCMLLRLGRTETPPNPEAVAAEFRRIIRDWLTPAECDEIDRLNAAEADPNVCHSHDFTDATQAILNALAAFSIEYDPHDVRHVQLANRAWSIAKGQGFGPAIIV